MKTVTIDRFTTFLLSSLLLLFLLSTLQIVTINEQILSLLIIGLVTLIFVLIVKNKSIFRKQINIYYPYMIFIAIYFINLINYSTISAVNNIIFYIFYSIFLFASSNLKWKVSHIKFFSVISYIVLPILFIYAISEVEIVNPNTIGIVSFILLFFPVLKIIAQESKLKKVMLILLFLFVSLIIILSGTRSVILSIIFMAITYFSWSLIIKNKTLFKTYFVLILLFIFSYTIIYPKLDKLLTNFQYYQELVIRYTGKDLYSGREEIWSILIDAIFESPFLGYGSGALASQFLYIDATSHNLYIEIALQVGLLGLIFFVIYLYKIWSLFWTNRFDKKVILSASFFIGILIHQLNEVLLIKSTVSINLFLWLIIGMGMSYCINKECA